jgi:hypothetical protein
VAVTVADVQPKNLENAKRQFVELYGSSLVLNTYLKIALVLVSLLALGLLALNFRTQAQYANLKPLVIRIDDSDALKPSLTTRPRIGLKHRSCGTF